MQQFPEVNITNSLSVANSSESTCHKVHVVKFMWFTLKCDHRDMKPVVDTMAFVATQCIGVCMRRCKIDSHFQMITDQQNILLVVFGIPHSTAVPSHSVRNQ